MSKSLGCDRKQEWCNHCFCLCFFLIPHWATIWHKVYGAPMDVKRKHSFRLSLGLTLQKNRQSHLVSKKFGKPRRLAFHIVFSSFLCYSGDGLHLGFFFPYLRNLGTRTNNEILSGIWTYLFPIPGDNSKNKLCPGNKLEYSLLLFLLCCGFCIEMLFLWYQIYLFSGTRYYSWTWKSEVCGPLFQIQQILLANVSKSP